VGRSWLDSFSLHFGVALLVVRLAIEHHLKRFVVAFVVRVRVFSIAARPLTRLVLQRSIAQRASHSVVASNSATISLAPLTCYGGGSFGSLRQLGALPVVFPDLIQIFYAVLVGVSLRTRLAFIEVPIGHHRVLVELVDGLPLSALETNL
jgi:hypothetical protein